MGIIIKQTFKGTFWSYFGVLVGFVTTSYLYTNYLSTDAVGLLGLLVSYSTLFAQFSLLGLHGVTSRMFTFFRDHSGNHHGFLFVSLLFFITGFIIFLIGYSFFSPYLIETNLEKSKLFADYVFLLVPLTFFTMLYIQLDTYNKVLYDSVTGIFLQDFLQRILIFFVTIVFAFGLLNLNQFVLAFAVIVSFKAIAIVLVLIQKKEISFRPDFRFLTVKLKKEILDVALFSVATGLGSMIVFNIDKIIINQMLDLSKTGVYTIAFYFGTLVVIPSRPFLKISGTLIADAWSKNDLAKIKEIYYKSCLTQFIIGGFIFLGIWSNIDNILVILGEDYLQSKWVIFFIGLAYLFDMLTGANTQIIAFSSEYRITALFIGILILIVLSLLFFLIPIWGIVGAAIAIAIGFLLNNAMRYLYLLKKYRLQPFNLEFIYLALFFTAIYLATTLIPTVSLIPDILLRSTLITVATVIFLYVCPISEDAKNILNAIIKKVSGFIS